MALRLLEIIIPEQYANEVSQLFAKSEVDNYWQTCGCETEVIFKTIIPAEKTEHIMDTLENRYAHIKEFRLVLLPVEASYPSPRDIEKKPEATEQVSANEITAIPLRVSRQELYHEVFDNAKASKVFFIMVSLSTIVAAIGLLRDNTAVIIGAMVIAPLLGPNTALSLATTLGDSELGMNALKTNLYGILLSFTISTLLGYSIVIDPSTPEIASRTVVSTADIILALAAGIAGALSFATGVQSALIGVMVAVALIPPLVVFGLLLGAGYVHKSIDAFILLTVNLICINIAGVVTFLVQGIRPINWWEAKKAKKATYKAIFIWIVLLTALLVLILITRTN